MIRSVSHSPQYGRPFQRGTARPKPQSQSFSRSYGSILPTSLIYIVLSTRGCLPWRPDAVMSTIGSANKSRHRFFKGRRKRTEAIQKRSPFPRLIPYLRSIRFQGINNSLRRKDNSPRSSRKRHRFRLCYHSISTFRLRNINLIPFR
jgi:hypothetical protein